MLESFTDDVQSLLDDEQYAFDNLPSSLQETEKGEKAETAICALQEAIESLEDAQRSLNEAMEV